MHLNMQINVFFPSLLAEKAFLKEMLAGKSLSLVLSKMWATTFWLGKGTDKMFPVVFVLD